MKFSTSISIALAVASVAHAGYVPTTTKCCDDSEITTFEHPFGLGVKECDDDTIYLVFEIGDGQLEHDCETVCCKSTPTPISDCDDDCEDDCEDDCQEEYGDDYKHKVYKRGEKYYKKKYSPKKSYDYSPLCHPYCVIDKECEDLFTLCDGVLYDEKYATGSIVANHQFQFDKPAQVDALFTCGWSIVYKDGYYLLALNDCTTFWECAVDDNGLYKLYDACIGGQCKEIEIIILFEEYY
ncbi:hypothetical protein KGF56_001182 [Candida oxycetoniae]|uniref:Cell wall mannoprotein PIR1-like C-terminal domain-containing protein n=1 Tax=Candida oxycetoniae TaxID=497107 RepID=A0AAI9WZ97_9ASCO|nr:uncharacterized protein KGF56_001182 [Candida oxycetoniae]KAI3405963.1 hypothetical protein KGF56_001182 [Candida oxycetoniae]